MNVKRKFYLIGAGWVSTSGYGTFGLKPSFDKKEGGLKFPLLENLLSELPARYGRFDTYTKACFSAAVLVLRDAGFTERGYKKNVGIVVGSNTGVYENDINFCKTTIENNGLFSSPNLFSYTLPNVALGEIAVYFGFTGPSFCVGNNAENTGMEVLICSLSLLKSSQCNNILAGWVETIDKDNLPFGAAFVFLSNEKLPNTKREFYEDEITNFNDLLGT